MSNISNSPNTAIDKPNQFPWKLYDMLHTAEKRNEEHIISWIKDGMAFKVHNRDLFIEEYMKKMFNQTKFKSFQRQLNLWGFERVQNGPDKGSYFHPLFVKGRRDCCQRLTRVRLKGTGEKAAQHGGVVDSSEQDYSPTSIASTATCSAVSTTGAASFPVAHLPVAARAGSVATATASSSSSLLGAFVDVPGPTANTTAIEASLQQGSSRQQQFADLIHYHTSQRRREMIRNAAIGLRPDLSLAIVGAPLFATASDTSNNIIVNDSIQRDQVSLNHHQQQQHQQQQQQLELEQQQKQLEQQQPRHQNHQQQHLQLSAHQEYQSQLLQRHHENTHTNTHTQQREQQSQTRPQSQSQPEEARRRLSGSSGLDALLSVSAQRRREEELALLLGPSDPGGTHKS
jgi:hypothetical protein